MLGGPITLPNRHKSLLQNNEPVGARTRDLRIKSPLLYRLSYRLKRKAESNASESELNVPHSAFSFPLSPEWG